MADNVKYNKILVTGADGFIGSHLTEILVRSGYDVRAMSLYNSFGSRGWLDTVDSAISGQVEFISGDIRDSGFVDEAVKGCDAVLHLAALIAIPYSYQAPESYIQTNITGTLNVVKAAQRYEVSKVVATSTSEVYGSAQFVPITEDHPLVGQSPYSASKIGADQIALSFQKSFDTPVAIARPFNTYGPRQSTRAVIPTIITQIAKGAKSIELGALHPTRDFSYVQDTADGIIACMKSDKTVGETVNLGSRFEVSIENTAKTIIALMGKEIDIVTKQERMRPDNSEVERLFAATEKAQKLLDWQPSYAEEEGFKKGLQKTIEWFTNPENLRFYQRNGYVI